MYTRSLGRQHSYHLPLTYPPPLFYCPAASGGDDDVLTLCLNPVPTPHPNSAIMFFQSECHRTPATRSHLSRGTPSSRQGSAVGSGQSVNLLFTRFSTVLLIVWSIVLCNCLPRRAHVLECLFSATINIRCWSSGFGRTIVPPRSWCIVSPPLVCASVGSVTLVSPRACPPHLDWRFFPWASLRYKNGATLCPKLPARLAALKNPA